MVTPGAPSSTGKAEGERSYLEPLPAPMLSLSPSYFSSCLKDKPLVPPDLIPGLSHSDWDSHEFTCTRTRGRKGDAVCGESLQLHGANTTPLCKRLIPLPSGHFRWVISVNLPGTLKWVILSPLTDEQAEARG